MTAVTRQQRWQSWAVAIRPRTLPAAVAPVLVGASLAHADDAFALLPVVACLAAALLSQIGASLGDDYLDFVHGVDTTARLGPKRAALGGLISLAEFRLGMTAALGAARLVGLYLVSIGGWLMLAIGITSVVSAVAYTGGPYPLGYHGLGDMCVLLFFGFAAVCGSHYIQALTLTPAVVVAAIPVGTLITAILVVSNLRDVKTDGCTGKRSLAVIIGKQCTRFEYAGLIGLAYSIPILFLTLGWPPAWVLLPWLPGPLAVRSIRTVYQASEGPVLNRALAGTASLALLFCVLFSSGLLPYA